MMSAMRYVCARRLRWDPALQRLAGPVPPAACAADVRCPGMASAPLSQTYARIGSLRTSSSGRQAAQQRQQRLQPPQTRGRRQTSLQAAILAYPAQPARRGGRNGQETHQYYVTCHPGLEEVVADELMSERIGAQGVTPGKAGVAFRASGPAVGYRANLWLRSATRVLQLLAKDELHPDQPGGAELYRATRQAADWAAVLSTGQAFSVDARIGSCTDVPTVSLVRTRVKDAICDAVQDAGRPKPQPPAPGQPADLPLFVSCFRDQILIYRDMSGESLHRRGYRAAMHRASLNEAAAAGILRLAGWHNQCAADPAAVFVDPMCGSGTLLIEAALMASRVAPGLSRRAWPFQRWPDFQPAAWREAVWEADRARQPWAGTALGNDVHAGALALALRDAETAGVVENLGLRLGSAGSWALPQHPSLTVTNPPWGQRLSDAEAATDLDASWQDLAAFFKSQCNESAVNVLCGTGSKYATRHLRMKADWKRPLSIGGVDARLLRYTVLPKMTPEKFNERGAALAAQK